MEHYEVTSEMCENCTEQVELTLINNRMQRLNSQRKFLYKLLGKTNRNKREWINGIESILKTLFGTLTESDLTYVNRELDDLYAGNKDLASSIKY